MKQTIKNIIELIRNNKGRAFVNGYPYFAVVDEESGILKERVLIDDDYCYYFDKENTLYVQNYLSGKTRKFKINK